MDSRVAIGNQKAFRRIEKVTMTTAWNLKSDKVQHVQYLCLNIVIVMQCEMWIVYCNHLKLLEHFHQKCLRFVLGINWEMHVSNVEVQE